MSSAPERGRPIGQCQPANKYGEAAWEDLQRGQPPRRGKALDKGSQTDPGGLTVPPRPKDHGSETPRKMKSRERPVPDLTQGVAGPFFRPGRIAVPALLTVVVAAVPHGATQHSKNRSQCEPTHESRSTRDGSRLMNHGSRETARAAPLPANPRPETVCGSKAPTRWSPSPPGGSPSPPRTQSLPSRRSGGPMARAPATHRAVPLRFGLQWEW